MSCPVCGAPAPRPRHRVGEFEILACGRCGLAWWPAGAAHRPEPLYDAAYFESAEADRGYDDYAGLEASLRRGFARRLARLPRPGAGARLLDVGAAYGFGVAEAARAGWRAFGLEVSAAAARAAGEAAGRIATGSALRAPFASQSFDAVTLWDVLEHLPDPHAAVSEVARLLRPGGCLALSTGDVGSVVARLSGGRWHLYNLPEHLFFFSRPSLRHLLGAHGLRVASMRAEGGVYTLGYLVERLRKSVLGRPARRPARFPGSGLAVPLNLFDIVTVRAIRADADPAPADLRPG